MPTTRAGAAAVYSRNSPHDEEEIERARVHGGLGDFLHTDMHEVIGHASGQIEEGVGVPSETLKNYAPRSRRPAPILSPSTIF